LELVPLWTQFQIFSVWNTIPSCVISNHFWWFEISKHKCFVVASIVFYASFFCIQFVWSTLCFMGLDSFISISEIHFKSPKVPSWVVCNYRNSFFCIRFVVNGKCHIIVFWQGLNFFCVIPLGRCFEFAFWVEKTRPNIFVIFYWFFMYEELNLKRALLYLKCEKQVKKHKRKALIFITRGLLFPPSPPLSIYLCFYYFCYLGMRWPL
jgi:hypothetical protein